MSDGENYVVDETELLKEEVARLRSAIRDLEAIRTAAEAWRKWAFLSARITPPVPSKDRLELPGVSDVEAHLVEAVDRWRSLPSKPDGSGTAWYACTAGGIMSRGGR